MLMLGRSVIGWLLRSQINNTHTRMHAQVEIYWNS